MWSKLKITYWVSTGLFSAFMFMSVFMYLTQTEMVKEAYLALGYPAYLLYFNALAKSMGAIAILVPKFKLLKEWAYAGFTYLLVLAVLGHVMVQDNQWAGAAVGLVLLIVSYVSHKKLQKN